MECTSCYSTMFLTIQAKCYDMCTVGYGDKGVTGTVPSNIGLGNNPNWVEFSYCMQCGKIHGDFPIQLPQAFKVVTPQPILPDEMVSDLIQQFYNAVMNKESFTSTSRLIGIISQHIQPTDASVLSSAWSRFEELRKIHPKLPEFDETVDWVMNKYRNVKLRSNMRAV